MKRVEENATVTVAPSHFQGQNETPRDCAADADADCNWGKPERNGDKPAWYLTLFH
jgi:hypothetical protein